MYVILGGGISGLTAAHYLLKRGIKDKVLLAEASDCLGGWIKSRVDKNSGVVFEIGPRTIRPSGISGGNTLMLIEELGLSDKVKPILKSEPAAKNRFICVGKKLHVLPSSLAGLMKIHPPFKKPLLLSVMKDLFAPVKKCSDDSLYNFVERRLGKEIADYAVSPLVCGICAGNAKEISVKFLMSSLFEAEQKYGSIFKGLFRMRFSNGNVKDAIVDSHLNKRAISENWSVWVMDGGLQTLPDTLKSKIIKDGVEISLKTPCSRIKFENHGVTCKIGNQDIHARHLVCSTAASSLGHILGPEHKALAEELLSIKYVTVGVVNLVYKGNLLKEDGFGFLVPPCEELPILGIIFDSCCNPQNNRTVLTVMMGGHWFNKYFGKKPTKDMLLETAISNVKSILHINEQPESTNTVILKDCIPQYVVGHQDRVKRIFDYIKENKLPLSLVGSSYHGVGLNDVIISSRTAIEELKI